MPEFRTSDGVALHYRVSGRGALPILYLHWMGGDSEGWHGLWTELGGERYRHIGFDCRGHGKSERTPSVFTNERLALDTLELADHLQLERMVLCGHSFGGKVALKLAAQAPERVSGVILHGAVGPGTVALARSDVEAILEAAGDLAFVRDTFRPWFVEWPRAELDCWTVNLTQTPGWARRAVCEAALWTPLALDGKCIAAPGLIFAGEHDPVYGPDYQRTEVWPALPEAALEVLPCGHGVALEVPALVARRSEAFLETLSR